MSEGRTKTLRRRAFELLEVIPYGDHWAFAIEVLIILLIVTNTAAVIMTTMPQLMLEHAAPVLALEWLAVTVFSVEYLGRVWVSVERLEARGMPPWKARLRYMVSPFAIIDILAILPFILERSLGYNLEILALLRLLRLFKLARYSSALGTLIRVLHNEIRPLSATAFLMANVIIMAASLMYFAERNFQPEKFGSIPDAMWWAVVTLTTVGYGDAIPITAFGKIIAGLTMISGLIFFALPVGIIASGFTSEVHRHDFLLRWEMVARVPLFENLDVSAIAHITRLLRSRRVRRGETICRAGTPGEGLFFIIDGEARAAHRRKVWELGPGDFFGELALLTNAPHEITVTALTPCRLMILEPSGFTEILQDHPDVRQQLETILSERLYELGEAQEVARETLSRALARWGFADEFAEG